MQQQWPSRQIYPMPSFGLMEPIVKMNHPLFQDGILQDTVSNTTFSQTLIFQGVLTPILCTNQDNNFQYRFFARKITPRI